MANKRMFSNAIIDQDEFIMLSQEAQLLYFHLGMKADDDGFVPTHKICKILGYSQSPLDELISGGFVIRFEGERVVAITHWWLNNKFQKDRYQPTRYQSLHKQLRLNDDKAYFKLEPTWNQNGTSLEPEWNQHETADKLSPDKLSPDKGRLGEGRLYEHSTEKGSNEGENQALQSMTGLTDFDRICICAQTQGIPLNDAVKSFLNNALDIYSVERICEMIINEDDFRVDLQKAAISRPKINAPLFN